MEELELLEKSKNDNFAIEELLSLYKPLVSKIARQYFLIGGDIDDLMQEGMIGLYKAINSYDLTKQASFKTFANLCITRQIQSAIKKANANKNKVFLELVDFYNDEHLYLATNKENPELNYISKQNYNALQDYISKTLSSLEKTVLNYYLAGANYQLIADKLEINKKSVDNALNRIRTKLTSYLDDKNY